MKKLFINLSDTEHRALKDDADANNRGVARHTLHLALQDSTVAERLAALLKRKASKPSTRKGAK